MAVRSAGRGWPHLHPSPETHRVVHLDALTGVRGLAAWWVVVHHFREALPHGTPSAVRTIAAQGYLAVDLFFILSGFVIALNYADRFEHSLKGSMRFLGLRLARIYPLHLFMLLLFLLNPLSQHIFSHSGYDGARYSPGYWLQSLFLVQNWGLTDRLEWNVPAWSISTEWLAYLAFPPLAWCMARFCTSVAAATIRILVLLATLAALTALTGSWLGEHIAGFGAVRCILEFCVGMGIYHLRAKMLRAGYRTSTIAFATFIVLTSVYIMSDVADYIVMPLAFACLVLALSDRDFALCRVLTNRPIKWLGVISFSTYLVHYFVRDWVKFGLVHQDGPSPLAFAVYIAATLVSSVVLYHCIEIPGQRLGRDLVSWMQSRSRTTETVEARVDDARPTIAI